MNFSLTFLLYKLKCKGRGKFSDVKRIKKNYFLTSLHVLVCVWTIVSSPKYYFGNVCEQIASSLAILPLQQKKQEWKEREDREKMRK